MLKLKKAQSTLEYIIIFTAIIGAVLLAANAVVRPKVQKMLEHTATQAESAVKHISFE